jgi:hypothetical protein
VLAKKTAGQGRPAVVFIKNHLALFNILSNAPVFTELLDLCADSSTAWTV